MNRLDSGIRRGLYAVLALVAIGLGGLWHVPAASAAQGVAPALNASAVVAQEPAAEPRGGGEANLRVPDLSTQTFLSGTPGSTLLMSGIVVCVLGLLFGLVIFRQLQALPVHRSIREVSELIYETCKTYLVTQGRFILILEIFIGAVILLYFKFLLAFPWDRVLIILFFSLVGIAGSYGVAWFGIRVNTPSLTPARRSRHSGEAYPCYQIPVEGGHEHRHDADLGRVVAF